VNDIVCISPIDGSEVARRRIATDAEIAVALVAARQAQRKWADVSLAERKTKILKFLTAMQAQNDAIVREPAVQIGRPVRYGGELRSFEERVHALVELSDGALAPIVPTERPGFRCVIKRVPAGIVLVIAPWNYPYLTAVNAIVLPKGLFTTLTLDHAAAEKLIASSRSVAHVNFTGSVGGGQAIERAAAGTFATLTLELGERIRPMCGQMPISTGSLSMAHSIIQDSVVAASSGSTLTRRSMAVSPKNLPISRPATNLAKCRYWHCVHEPLRLCRS
jgi:acyl-CoA reductase-like NAD-dependent aldehyde dehydrogenase